SSPRARSAWTPSGSRTPRRSSPPGPTWSRSESSGLPGSRCAEEPSQTQQGLEVSRGCAARKRLRELVFASGSATRNVSENSSSPLPAWSARGRKAFADAPSDSGRRGAEPEADQVDLDARRARRLGPHHLHLAVGLAKACAKGLEVAAHEELGHEARTGLSE